MWNSAARCEMRTKLAWFSNFFLNLQVLTEFTISSEYYRVIVMSDPPQLICTPLYNLFFARFEMRFLKTIRFFGPI